MQAVYQNLYVWLRHLTVTYTVVLHCTRPHTSSGMATDESRTATAAGVLMFTCPVSVIPYWILYALLLRKARHTFKFFVMDVFYNERY
jgi:hypothetical protein